MINVDRPLTNYLMNLGKKSAKRNNIACTIDINFVTNISAWDALKLRLAGGEVIREFLEKRIQSIESENKEQNKHATDSK